MEGAIEIGAGMQRRDVHCIGSEASHRAHLDDSRLPPSWHRHLLRLCRLHEYASETWPSPVRTARCCPLIPGATLPVGTHAPRGLPPAVPVPHNPMAPKCVEVPRRPARLPDMEKTMSSLRGELLFLCAATAALVAPAGVAAGRFAPAATREIKQ